MAEEYISREAAKEKHCDICKEQFICYRANECDEAKAFDAIPAADVKPVVRAKWKSVKTGYICTACKKHPGIVRAGRGAFLSTFCPNCGADMREVDT